MNGLSRAAKIGRSRYHCRICAFALQRVLFPANLFLECPVRNCDPHLNGQVVADCNHTVRAIVQVARVYCRVGGSAETRLRMMRDFCGVPTL